MRSGLMKPRPERSLFALEGVRVGRIVELGEGSLTVDWPENQGPARAARTLVELDPDSAGLEVALVFERGDPEKPIVLGLFQEPGISVSIEPAGDGSEAEPIQVETDGQTMVLEAEKEIVLRCGRASLTLTRAGKILLRGTYVLSRSSGANVIKGGSVEIN